MPSNDDSFLAVKTANSAMEQEVLRSLLEACGIPTRVNSDYANELYGLANLPLTPHRGNDPLEILVPADRKDEAIEILAARAGEPDPSQPFSVLLDWEHNAILSDGKIPEGPVDDIVDMTDFRFVGEAEGRGRLFSFFLEYGNPGLPKGKPGLSRSPVTAIGETVPGLFDAWREVFLDGYDPPSPITEIFGFCGEPEGATELGALVLTGKKTGTASLLLDYEDEGESLPEKGSISIIVDGKGTPLCAIETVDVALVPFDEVTAEHARAEGEGDLSLEYWRKVHRRFFQGCRTQDRPFLETSIVVCERFEVIERFKR